MTHRFNRRRFLRSSACALGMSSNAISISLQLGLANAAIAAEDNDPNGYRALVCIFLHGGNDSFNMLLPASPDEHKQYQKTRGDLALHLTEDGVADMRAQILNHSDSRLFAVHPALEELRALYDQKQLAFLANVGTLIEPTSLASYRNQSARLPLSLFSHNDQRDHWHTATPQSHGKSGWIGRATELLLDTKEKNAFSNTFSFSGNNLLQTGVTTQPFCVNANGSMALQNPATATLLQQAQHSGAASLLSQVFSSNSALSIEKNKHYSQIFDTTPEISNTYPDTTLGKSLKAIARTISARKRLTTQRQTFFVSSHGWDSHQEMLPNHHRNLLDLSRSISAFQKSMSALGVSENVTTFTASEFGRTLVSNGRGTDHGWGGNALIMGGAVSGGSIYGHYPEVLRPGDGQDIGKNGRLLPTTACDLYFAELLKWYGLSNDKLFIALPNLDNFYSQNEFRRDLPFMTKINPH